MEHWMFREDPDFMHTFEQPTQMFILSVLKKIGHLSLEELRSKFGDVFPVSFDGLIEELIHNGFLKKFRSEIVLTTNGQRVVAGIDFLRNYEQESLRITQTTSQDEPELVSRRELASRVRKFYSSLQKNVQTSNRRDIDGGLSSYKVVSLIVHPENPYHLQGHYILKICDTEKALHEVDGFSNIKDNRILRHNIPNIAYIHECKNVGLTGIFYTVAGNGLAHNTTLQSIIKDYYPLETIEKLAKTILRWNMSSKRTSFDGSDIVENIRNGLGVDRINDLRSQIGQFVANANDLYLAPPFGEKYKLNPIPFIFNSNVEKKLLHYIPTGQLHGDLNLRNIIIPRPHYPGTFNIIDFGSAREGNALFDLAYFELSLILQAFSGNNPILYKESWAQLEEYLCLGILPKGSFPNLVGANFILPIRRAVYYFAKKDNLYESYWISFLAASVEAGFNYFRKLDDFKLKCISLLFASFRFDELMKLCQFQPKDRTIAHTPVFWPL